MYEPRPIAEVCSADGSSKIQLTRVGRGKGQLVLRQLSWGSGIGWFAQNSISIDPAQAKSLAAALEQSADLPLDEEQDDGPTIIPFPTIRLRRS
jgi:hypothetical protein